MDRKENNKTDCLLLFKEALEIANNFEDQIKIVDNELSYPQVLRMALYTADRIKCLVPMYTGNLNPNWKKYDIVIEILKGRLIEKQNEWSVDNAAVFESNKTTKNVSKERELLLAYEEWLNEFPSKEERLEQVNKFIKGNHYG